MNEVVKRTITGFVLSSFFWIAYIYFPPIVFSGVLFLILIQILVIEWPTLFTKKSPSFWLVMPFYPILPFAMLIYLNITPQYHNLLLILFMIVSSFDTGGYIIGSLIGKHKIAPWISPGKTWEGFIGGYISAVLGLMFVLWEVAIREPLWLIFGFTLLICILGICGDMFESWLKRRAGVKDSGRILPGHGGFLDRFDGILFAVVFFYVFRDWLVKLFS